MPDAVPAVLQRKNSVRAETERRPPRSIFDRVPKRDQAADHSGKSRSFDPLEIEALPKNAEASSTTLLAGIAPALNGGVGAYRILYISVCAVAFANAMTFSVLGPFLPAYLSGRFGSSSTQVGMIMAAYPAVNLATSPMIGCVMNRYGRWNVLFAGLSTLAVATALYGLASTIPWLYIASGLHGASLSLIHVSSLGLLSAFPARTTESMAGIEIWSGVALILGPPLGCLVFPYGGVPSVFFSVAIFPVALMLFVPKIRRLLRSGEGESVGEAGPLSPLSWTKALKSRGVLAGAAITAYNYGIIGFLEVTLAPHLERTLSTSPTSIGFVLVLPNILYTVTAMKAEDVVEKNGVKSTLLWGLGIMGASLMLFGPNPAIAPAMVYRGTARGAIGVGLLAFQVGSALASVPAFTAMHEGVAGMGGGADNLVASMHSMSIGVGEVVGPILGGFMAEHLPKSSAFACDPGTMALVAETVFHQQKEDTTGEVLRDHPEEDSGKQTWQKSDEKQQKEAAPRILDRKNEAVGITWEANDGDVGVNDGGAVVHDSFDSPRVSSNREVERNNGEVNDPGVTLMMVDREKNARKLKKALPLKRKPSGSGKVQRKKKKLGERENRHVDDGKQQARGAKAQPEFEAVADEVKTGEGAPFQQKNATDVLQGALAEDVGSEVVGRGGRGGGEEEVGVGGDVSGAAGANATAHEEEAAVVAIPDILAAMGGGNALHLDGGDSVDHVESCKTSFPLATTLLAWVSLFAFVAMYRMLPGASSVSKGRSVGRSKEEEGMLEDGRL